MPVSIEVPWAVSALAAAGLVGATVGASAVWRERRRDSERMRAIAEGLGVCVEQGASAAAATGELELAAAGTLDRLAEAGEQGALLREALDSLAEAVVVAGPSGEILLQNRAAVALSAQTSSGVLLSDAVRSALEVARGGDATDRELGFYGPPRLDLFLRARPLRDGEKVLGAVVVVEDVSGAHRVDTVRRDFVANVSHELRTPIGAIALLGETILAAGDPAATERLAGRVVQEAERLGRIVDDLLDLSAIEAVETPVRERHQVAEILSEAAERVCAVAEAAGTPLEFASPVPGLAVAGDRRQLVGALVNLVENAVKYSERGSRVAVSACEDDGRVVLTVSDEGIGIPRRHLERIFERFYRVDRARSRDSGGTGLGLSIVRHVARAHGGEVTVESREGEGSTFRIVLPVVAADPGEGA